MTSKIPSSIPVPESPGGSKEVPPKLPPAVSSGRQKLPEENNMKKIILAGLIAMSVFSGCYHSQELEREPAKVRSNSGRKQIKTPRHRNNNDGKDPLFEAVFHRNQQDYSDSSLSQAERELLKQNRTGDDPVVRELHNNRRKSANDRQDWVFGTKNGSYF